uniref:Uncharacterized protein n=1 Tax=Oryza glaberrima TaxID=4538 RepID=I1P036_ORYGL
MARGLSDSSILASPPVESVARMESTGRRRCPLLLSLSGRHHCHLLLSLSMRASLSAMRREGRVSA